MFMIRGGYRIGDDLGALRLGAGIKYKNFSIDYSFNNFGDLGSANRIGLKISVGNNDAVVKIDKEKISEEDIEEETKQIKEEYKEKDNEHYLANGKTYLNFNEKQYYQKAIKLFNKIPENSKYYKEAQEYIKLAKSKMNQNNKKLPTEQKQKKRETSKTDKEI